MEEIKAYIKEHKLDAVTLALHQVEGLTETLGWQPNRKPPQTLCLT